MTYTMVNRTRRRLIIRLDHPAFQRRKFGFQRRVIRTIDLNPRTGERGVKEHRKALNGSLTLLKGERITGLPREIAAIPQVRKLRKKGDIELIEVAEKSDAEAPAPKVEEPAEKPVTKKTKARNGK
jgi:hypothetical protein